MPVDSPSMRLYRVNETPYAKSGFNTKLNGDCLPSVSACAMISSRCTVPKTSSPLSYGDAGRSGDFMRLSRLHDTRSWTGTLSPLNVVTTRELDVLHWSSELTFTLSTLRVRVDMVSTMNGARLDVSFTLSN